MKILMQSGENPSELSPHAWDHAIVGHPVDRRGNAAVDFVKASAKVTHTLGYDPKRLQVDLDGQILSAEEPENFFTKFAHKTVVLEATTLGFVEILLCFRALRESKINHVSVLYTEPKSYFRPIRHPIVHRRNFELSNEVEEFMAVPGNTILLSSDRLVKVVVFGGYEGQRLSRFLEQTGIAPSKCSIVFGVPAYHAGWEMNAFANYFSIIKGGQISGRVLFCGAQNPLSAYEKLDAVYNSCVGERMLIAPIGTKPHGIAAALFLSEHSDVGVIYDYPKRKKDRSDDIDLWHLFSAELLKL